MLFSGRSILLLASSSLVCGNVLNIPRRRDANPPEVVLQNNASYLDTFQPGASRLIARDASNGQKCGAANGGASCAAGWCCSDAGLCGQGGSYCGAPACQLSSGPACDGNKSPVGHDTSNTPRPLFGNVPYGVNIHHCNAPGKVALTFDDGPYIYTTQILDALKAAGVKATFFIVANNGAKGEIDDPATGYPAIVQRMFNDGHQIGSHTWSHQDLAASTHEQRVAQIVKNEIAISNILGFFPTYLRTPYVSCNQPCLDDLRSFGYHVAFYDVDTNDWQGDYVAAKKAYVNALSGGSPAASSFIVLAHDIHQQTVQDLLPYMLTQLKQLGYTTTTLGDCLGDPPANWYRDPATGGPYVVKNLPNVSTSAPAKQASPEPKPESSSSISSTSSSSSSSSSISTTSSSSSSGIAVITPTPVSSDMFGAKSSGTPTIAAQNLTAKTSGTAKKGAAAVAHPPHLAMQSVGAFIFGLVAFAVAF